MAPYPTTLAGAGVAVQPVRAAAQAMLREQVHPSSSKSTTLCPSPDNPRSGPADGSRRSSGCTTATTLDAQKPTAPSTTSTPTSACRSMARRGYQQVSGLVGRSVAVSLSVGPISDWAREESSSRRARVTLSAESEISCNTLLCPLSHSLMPTLNSRSNRGRNMFSGWLAHPTEFKEIRKAWRQRKKDQDAANNANGDDGANASRSPGKDKGSSAATLKDRPRTGGGLPPPGPSLATELRGPRIPGIDGTPPTSTHLPTTPTFNNVTGFSGYFSASPNGYGRPNTAPGQMAYHLGGAGGGSGVAPISAVNAVSASPMLGGLPPGYLGARKGSVTSVPPAFASIQEDAVGESTAGPPLSYDTPPSASAGVGSLVPGDLVGGGTEGIRNAGFYGGSNSQSGGGAMGVGHDNGSRPSTASSPFRYSVSYDSTPTNGHHHHQPQPQQDIHGAFADSLTGHHPHPQGYPVHEAHFPPASTAMSEQDSWSAEWKNLSQPAGQYNQTEIR